MQDFRYYQNILKYCSNIVKTLCDLSFCLQAEKISTLCTQFNIYLLWQCNTSNIKSKTLPCLATLQKRHLEKRRNDPRSHMVADAVGNRSSCVLLKGKSKFAKLSPALLILFVRVILLGLMLKSSKQTKKVEFENFWWKVKSWRNFEVLGMHAGRRSHSEYYKVQ